MPPVVGSNTDTKGTEEDECQRGNTDVNGEQFQILTYLILRWTITKKAFLTKFFRDISLNVGRDRTGYLDVFIALHNIVFWVVCHLRAAQSCRFSFVCFI